MTTTRTKIIQGFNQDINSYMTDELINIFNIFKNLFSNGFAKYNLILLNIIFRNINNNIQVLLHFKQQNKNQAENKNVNSFPKITWKNYNNNNFSSLILVDDIKQMTYFMYETKIIFSIHIYIGDVYDRNVNRINICGPDFSEYTFSNNKTIRFSCDSFLQQNLQCAEKLYSNIESELNKYCSIESELNSKIVLSLFSGNYEERYNHNTNKLLTQNNNCLINKSINFNCGPKKNYIVFGLGDDCLNISSYLELDMFTFMHCEQTQNCYIGNNLSTLDLNTWINKIISQYNSGNKILITTPGRKGLSDNEFLLIMSIHFTYIYYISCCTKSYTHDMNKFKQVGYKISKYYTYPEMFEQTSGYLETLTILTKKTSFEIISIEGPVVKIVEPIYISVGSDCSIAYHICIEKLNKGNMYFPFDWCKINGLDIILSLLEQNFEQLFDMNNFKIKNLSDMYFIMGDTENNNDFKLPATEQTLVVEFSIPGVKGYIQFPHDFKTFTNEEFEEFKIKMRRRINRFLAIPIEQRRFIRYETRSLNSKIRLEYSKLSQYSGSTLVITNRQLINYPLIKRVKFIYDNTSSSHTSWKREGLNLSMYIT